MRLWILIPLVSATALPAAAQGVDCNNQRTQYEINVCTNEAAQRSDDVLNRVWKQLKPRADAAGWGDRLLNEQRAWLKTRDARCEAERESFGQGSFAPAAFMICIDEMTQARTAQLRAMF